MFNNRLTSINENIFQSLVTLEELNLGGNKINKIEPRAFENLKNLKKFNLNFNEITEINPNIFKSFEYLTDLQELDLGGNRNDKIDPKAFEKLKNLKTLILRSNAFTEIDQVDLCESFKYLPRLQELDLSKNKIENICPNAFEKLKSLKKLSLCDNNLKEINKLCFMSFESSIGLIDLRNNKFFDSGDSPIVSFFNEFVFQVAENDFDFDFRLTPFKHIDISKYKLELNSAGGYLSDFQTFLFEFPEVVGIGWNRNGLFC